MNRSLFLVAGVVLTVCGLAVDPPWVTAAIYPKLNDYQADKTAGGGLQEGSELCVTFLNSCNR